MKIYKIHHNPDAPNLIAVPDNRNFHGNTMLRLAKQPDDLELPRFQMEVLGKVNTGFFDISNKVLTFSWDVYMSELGSILGLAGRIFKSSVTDTEEAICMLDVTAVYNCIDKDNTFYHTPNFREEKGVDHGARIAKPAFFTTMIGDSSLFRIPQQMGSIYTVARGYGGDFYTLYHEAGHVGLTFTQVWPWEDA